MNCKLALDFVCLTEQMMSLWTSQQWSVYPSFGLAPWNHWSAATLPPTSLKRTNSNVSTLPTRSIQTNLCTPHPDCTQLRWYWRCNLPLHSVLGFRCDQEAPKTCMKPSCIRWSNCCQLRSPNVQHPEETAVVVRPSYQIERHNAWQQST